MVPFIAAMVKAVKPVKKATLKVKAKVLKPKKAAAAKAKTKVAPKKASAPKLSLHPHHASNVPTLVHNGQATSIPDVVRQDVPLYTADRVLILCSNVGSSGALGWYVRWGAGSVWNNNVLTPQLLSVSGVNGGPSSIRAMKAGLSVVNTTPLLNRGGRVYTLNCEQRLLFPAAPSTLTATQLDAVFDSVTQHPHTHVHDGTDFGDAKHMSCVVCDTPAYENFEENDGAPNVDNFLEHLAQWPTSGNERRPMSCVIVALDIPANAQTYTFEFTGRWYTRWPLSTVAGRLQTDIPVASSQIINSAHAASRAGMHFPAPVRLGASTIVYG